MIKWVLQTFSTVLVTMVFIYIIKKTSNKYNIPVLKPLSEGV